MRKAYMPREGAPTPVPHNPFRQNRSAADLLLASSKARWPADAARRDSSGSKAVPVPERAAAAVAARQPLDPSTYQGAEPAKEARVEAAVSTATPAADAPADAAGAPAEAQQ
jgi:hypothetical protein